jgi:hypothetical protein
LLRLLSVAVLVGICACGGKAADGEDECVEGRRLQCACDGSWSGYSICAPDGGAGACFCPPVGHVDAASDQDGSAQTDASAPFALELANECRVDRNVLFVFADQGARGYPVVAESPNPALIDVVRFSMATSYDQRATVEFQAEPSGYQYGGPKDYIFSLRNVKKPLATGVMYEDAVDPGDSKSSNPVLAAFGGCYPTEKVAGRFIFHALIWTSADRPSSFLVAFERRCGAGNPALRGCVHYDSKNPQ